MVQHVDVQLLPQLASPEQFSGSTTVVIDVLRATSTIVAALVAGATRVVPCLEVDEARRVAGNFRPVLLGGERGGLRVEGFDLGNSPNEYTAEIVHQKSVVFTTTNGTRAMRHASLADRVLLGSFLNLSALVEQIAEAERISLLCAGTDGQITREDAMLAGAVVERCRACREHVALNDQARIVAAVWKTVREGERALADELRDTQGGRNLVQIGHEADIDWVAKIDRFDRVPQLSLDRSEVCLL